MSHGTGLLPPTSEATGLPAHPLAPCAACPPEQPQCFGTRDGTPYHPCASGCAFFSPSAGGPNRDRLHLVLALVTLVSCGVLVWSNREEVVDRICRSDVYAWVMDHAVQPCEDAGRGEEYDLLRMPPMLPCMPQRAGGSSRNAYGYVGALISRAGGRRPASTTLSSGHAGPSLGGAWPGVPRAPWQAGVHRHLATRDAASSSSKDELLLHQGAEDVMPVTGMPPPSAQGEGRGGDSSRPSAGATRRRLLSEQAGADDGEWDTSWVPPASPPRIFIVESALEWGVEAVPGKQCGERDFHLHLARNVTGTLVADASEADLFFVPFYASCRPRQQLGGRRVRGRFFQALVEGLADTFPPWRRFQGADFFFYSHRHWTEFTAFGLPMRQLLTRVNAMFLLPEVTNLAAGELRMGPWWLAVRQIIVPQPVTVGGVVDLGGGGGFLKALPGEGRASHVKGNREDEDQGVGQGANSFDGDDDSGNYGSGAGEGATEEGGDGVTDDSTRGRRRGLRVLGHEGYRRPSHGGEGEGERGRQGLQARGGGQEGHGVSLGGPPRPFVFAFVGGVMNDERRAISASLSRRNDSFLRAWCRARRTNAARTELLTSVYSSADFCILARGDSRSDSRLFDALRSGCIPVLTDRLRLLPFASAVDYGAAVVWVSSPTHADTMSADLDRLAAMPREEVARRRLAAVRIAQAVAMEDCGYAGGLHLAMDELAMRWQLLRGVLMQPGLRQGFPLGE
eukprot:jgi/Mesvir1/730/Mv17337-RA.2